jgi:hypothetical protein
MPVCGCNGLTYSSACDANGAGVSIAYSGECGSNVFNSPYLTASDGGLISWGQHSASEILYANLQKSVILGGGASLYGIVISSGTLDMQGVTLQ